MTPDAVFEVSNAFVYMDRSHVVWLMFVASVAGVAAVIIVGVTGHACRVVIAIQHEELVMDERSGLPAFRTVALFATHAEIAMNVVLWSGVASLAAIPCSARNSACENGCWLRKVNFRPW